MTSRSEVMRIGAARIGLRHATWPFAQLLVSQAFLTVRMPGASITLARDEVVALQSFHHLPIIGSGIRILHVRLTLGDVRFWVVRPAKLLAEIGASGFLPATILR